jgi:hypothetical protein
VPHDRLLDRGHPHEGRLRDTLIMLLPMLPFSRC